MASTTPTATTAAAPASPVAPITAAWPTYYGDVARRGVDTTAFSAGAVRNLWQSPDLDGQVYAEPLVVGGVVIVATEANSVYALNAATGAIRWQAELGAAVSGASLPCGNVNPVGITGTPVIDVARGILYAVTFTQPAKHTLVALQLTSGNVVWQRVIDPDGADPRVQIQRGALALANGTIYVPFGGRYGDCGNYHGWIVGAPIDGTGPLLTYQVPTAGGGGLSNGGGGIWAPSGVAIDADGNIFVATGNGGSTAFDYSDSVLKLGPKLNLLDYFAPANWATLSRQDLDLGSVAPSLLDNVLIFVAGKEGTGYLLWSTSLGKVGGQAFTATACTSSGAFGATAYAPPMLYVPCTTGLVALKIDDSPAFSVAWRGPRFRPGPPVIAGGAVWTIGRDGTIYALDAQTGEIAFQASVGASATSFPSLAASANRLYATAGRRIVCFGST